MKKSIAALASGVVLLAGCADNPLTNPVDSPTVGQVSGALTRASLQTLVTGVVAQDRATYGSSTNYIILSEVMARDLYQNGVVLERKKYRLLAYAYWIFLAGLVAAAAAFVLDYF